MMKSLIIGIGLLTILFSSCNQPAEKETASERIALGDREYGGKFRVNERETVQSLFPYQIIDATSYRVASQLYEGLVKLDSKELTILPSLAESWEVDANRTTYTFHLKQGVMFHDDSCFPDGKGREVKAGDVSYSFEVLCTERINDSTANLMFSRTFMDRVVGANAYYEASKKGKPDFSLEGVKVIDDYTVAVTLTQPSSSFLYSLCYPAAYIVAEEAVGKYGSELIIGTGPFVLGGWNALKDANGRMIEQLILTRNENYHGYDTLGNQLPYLDTIQISFINSQKRELEMFQDKKLDIIVGLPSESVRDIVEQKIAYFEQDPPVFILEQTADMSTNYYVFNLTKDIFKDKVNGKKVRQAISHAIDRKKIVEKTLSGEAAGPGIHGITPPSLKNYDITKVSGYEYDVEKARQLMAEAGFLNGEGFPTISLKLNTGGARNVNVGMEIQKQLRQNLGINLELDIMSMDQLLEDKRNANGDIFRSGWIADFPSPENFLMLLYGKSVPEDVTAPSNLNTARYSNSTFDELYEKGLDSDSTNEKYDFFAQAEQVMIDDAPVIVLWYDEHHRLIQSNVQNLVINPMHIRDYSVVYFQDPKPRASRAANNENGDATADEKVSEEGAEG